MDGDVRRVVNGPDGSRYEVVGMAKDWKLSPRATSRCAHGTKMRFGGSRWYFGV
jgi:hypothetical protein